MPHSHASRSNKAAFSLRVSTLQEFLDGHRADDALLNREHHLRCIAGGVQAQRDSGSTIPV